MSDDLKRIDFLLKQLNNATFATKGGDVATLMNTFQWLVKMREDLIRAEANKGEPKLLEKPSAPVMRKRTKKGKS